MNSTYFVLMFFFHNFNLSLILKFLYISKSSMTRIHTCDQVLNSIKLQLNVVWGSKIGTKNSSVQETKFSLISEELLVKRFALFTVHVNIFEFFFYEFSSTITVNALSSELEFCGIINIWYGLFISDLIRKLMLNDQYLRNCIIIII